MRLSELPVLFLDCQTTGMRPSNGHLLEIAWSQASPTRLTSPLESHLLQLPEGETVPAVVSKLTGIQTTDLADARTMHFVFTQLKAAIDALPQPQILVIHYAQFEAPFLHDLWQRFSTDAWPATILCSHRLCKRLMPELPNANIRGAAGYFGQLDETLQRADSHVRATQIIWRGLVQQLQQVHAIETLTDLQNWQSTPAPPKKPSVRYAYRLDRLKRLELPDQPGVYRMLAKNGKVLYVGKATSLKSRVNSYFRGQKNRDRFKLEMLAQVWDLQVTTCTSPLEAALLESDEIKQHNPKYNLVLKTGRRRLMFYNSDLTQASAEPGENFPFGPFRNTNCIEPLRLLERSVREPEFQQVFYQPLDQDQLRAGLILLCSLYNLDLKKVRSPRSLLAFGLWRFRRLGTVDADREDSTDEHQLTPLDVAGKLDRLMRRAAAEHIRTRQLTKLLNASISVQYKNQTHRLHFHRGRQVPEEAKRVSDLTAPTVTPWQGLDIVDFDRMSILLSELAKVEHQFNSL